MLTNCVYFDRMVTFMDNAKTVVDYFEPFLGRIEIMGGAGRIERVYFEITQQHIDQWEKPQIRVSTTTYTLTHGQTHSCTRLNFYMHTNSLPSVLFILKIL